MPCGDLPLGLCRESPGHPGRRDPMAAEVRDPGAGEDAEDLGIAPGERAHQAQLPARRRQRRVVVAVDVGGPFERHHCGGLVPEQEMGFRRRGCRVVGALLAAARCVEGSACELARHLRLAGDEAERGCVDRGVVAARARMDRPIAIAGTQRLRAPAVERGVEREILRDARGERRDVLPPPPPPAVRSEGTAARPLSWRPRARARAPRGA